MLHDPAVAKEFEEEFQRDKLAFEGLPPNQQKWVRNIAKGEYHVRRVLISSTRAVIGALEFAANIFLRLPYVMAARFIGGCANKLVQGVKLGVHGLALGARAVLGWCNKGMDLAERGLRWLEKKGVISRDNGEKGAGKLDAAKKKLGYWRDNIVAWGKQLSDKIERGWDRAKTAMHNGLVKAGECAEYYGAIGLYRGTKWILNPRRPDGKPLLGSEKVNRAVGLAAAAVLFVGLSFQLSKLFVLGKIWHIKLAHSFVKDVGVPLSHRLAKQITLQPLLAGGLASAKFVTLPIIAAARGALKSTPFTQGLSYQYNCLLREKRAAREAKLNTEPTSKLGAAAKKVQRGSSALKRYLHKKTLNFVGVFVEHIVEKASPEFYEARYKHYQEVGAPLSMAKPAQQPAPSAAAPEAVNPVKPAVSQLPALTPEFDRANDNALAAEAPAPQPKPAPKINPPQ